MPTEIIEVAEITCENIIRYAINSNKNFTFDKLKKAYLKLKSMSQFMKILGEKKIKITANRKNLSPNDLLLVCKEVLNSLDTKVKDIMFAKNIFAPLQSKKYP